MREDGEDGYFWCKDGIGGVLFPSALCKIRQDDGSANEGGVTNAKHKCAEKRNFLSMSHQSLREKLALFNRWVLGVRCSPSFSLTRRRRLLSNRGIRPATTTSGDACLIPTNLMKHKKKGAWKKQFSIPGSQITELEIILDVFGR